MFFSAAQGILFFFFVPSFEIIKKAFWDEKSFLNGSLNSCKGCGRVSFFCTKRVCLQMITESCKLRRKKNPWIPSIMILEAVIMVKHVSQSRYFRGEKQEISFQPRINSSITSINKESTNYFFPVVKINLFHVFTTYTSFFPTFVLHTAMKVKEMGERIINILQLRC